MSAYVMATYTVTNLDKLGEYRQAVVPTIINHGGKVLVAGPANDNLEGEFAQVMVVIEFDSVENAQKWYHSEEYAKIRHLRHDSTADGWVIITEQFVLPVAG